MFTLNMKMRATFRSVALSLILLAGLNTIVLAQNKEVFYRVHQDEFAEIQTRFANISPYTFIIAAPGQKVALPFPTSDKIANPAGIDVDLSDDCEELYITEPNNYKNIKFNFESASTGNKSFYIYKGWYIGAEKDGNRAYFLKDGAKDASSQFVAEYSDSDDGMLALRSCIGNSSGSYYLILTGSKRFVLNTTGTDRTSFSIYRIDAFNMSLDCENEAESHSIELKLNLSDAAIVSNVYFNYILNRGEDVTLNDLLTSENSVKFVRKGTKLDYEPVIIPTDGNSTTVWVLPVLKDVSATYSVDNKDYPFGRIFKGVFAENGGGDISTGIVSVANDKEDGEVEYYTTQGLRASEPLAPGFYIKRQGAKTSKVLVK